MKTKLFIALTVIFGPCGINAQGTWNKRTDFSGASRDGAVGFSIGIKGYLSTGGNSSALYKDLREFDPVTNQWTQKASFAGVARYNAIGFSIGNYGYLGLGAASTYLNDLWQYDPSLDKWTQKANFPGNARAEAVGFTIGNKAYVGTGFHMSGSNYYWEQDFYEYNPSLDKWTKLTDFPGGTRSGAIGFSIGNKGYLGMGYDNISNTYAGDLWEYDPANNSWKQVSDFPAAARERCATFSIGNKGYVGGGSQGSPSNGPYFKDFYEYDATTDKWTKLADFGGTGRDLTTGFTIGNKGYMGLGYGGGGTTTFKDVWEYTPASTSGFNEPKENKTEILIYPNPFFSYAAVQLDTHLKLQNAAFVLYDLTGFEIRRSTISEYNFVIERAELSSGNYLYRVSSENVFVGSGRVVVE